jgi:hypothetical protein
VVGSDSRNCRNSSVQYLLFNVSVSFNLKLVDSVAIAVDRIKRGFSTQGDQITALRQDNDARL